MSYRRLTQKNRYQIEAYLNSGISRPEIAIKMNIHPSTLSRELKRVSGVYNADAAHLAAQAESSSRRGGKYFLSGKLESYVRSKLESDWSPEQIVGRRKRARLKTVSQQTIYRYVARLKLQGDELWQHLRILKKERRERTAINYRTLANSRNGRVHIDQRPSIVEKRERLGDLERDTVFGSKNEVLLLTIVDRVSRKTWIELVDEKCSEKIHLATIRALQNETVHTITNDNGTEFAQHHRTAEALKTSIYFSRAYRSWERGTNENTNGLIRQYCPKKRSIAHLKDADVRRIEDLLNNRPRKSLGFRTPNEVHRAA